jgi:hypothetical protein
VKGSGASVQARFLALCALALAGGALVAGCGGGGSSASSSSTTNAARTQTTTTSSGSGASGASGAGTTPSRGGGAATSLLKTECQSVQVLASAMPANLKNAVASACQKVAKGNLAAAKSKFKQACESAVKLLPAGTERASVAAMCKQL